ncbi:MAG: hypothetical protein AMXMBFR47_02760 [Planctomycetota bacterium]
MRHKLMGITTLIAALLVASPILSCKAANNAQSGRQGRQPDGSWDDSEFTGYANLDDGRTGVFIYTASRYKSRGDGGLFGFGTPYHVENDVIIGAFDFERLEFRALYRATQRKGADGRTAVSILSSCGQKLLLYAKDSQECSLPEGGPYYLFDAALRSLIAIPLQEEMESNGMTVGWIRVVCGDGTLMFRTAALQNRNRNWAQDPSIPMELWVRHPSGDYIHVATTREFTGIRGNELFYRSPEGNFAFDFESNQTRKVSRAVFGGPWERGADQGIYAYRNDLFWHDKNPDGSTTRTKLEVDPRALKLD